MGKSESTLRDHLVLPERQKEDTKPGNSPGDIEFVPGESYCLSIGIDNQTHPRFKHKTLTCIAGRDATHISTAANKQCELLL